MPTRDNLADLYESQTVRREPYWRRARDNASLTIPSLFPEIGFNESTDFPDPFQSVGASGLASKTSKLLLALFPPGVRYFAIEVTPKLSAELRRQGQGALTDFETQRDLREKIIQFHTEIGGFRVRAAEAIKLLLSSGTIILQRAKKKAWRVWRLPQFVCHYSGDDDLLYAVTKEAIEDVMLTPEVRALPKVAEALAKKTETFDLYTGWIRGTDGKFETYQEIEGERIPDSEGSFKPEDLPMHVSRFDPLCGEPYGRPLFDRVHGDLASLEGLQQSIVELGAECSRLTWGVRPNAVVKPTDLEGKPNGAYCTMNEGDVFAVKVDKLTDLTAVSQIAQTLRADIQQQLGMHLGVQRQAERVTAYEIQEMARELDSTDGGTYSSMSEELQLPVLRMIESELVREGELLRVKGNVVHTRIVAGYEGLGRSIKFGGLQRFLALVTAIPPEEQTGFELDRRALYEEAARASGIDPAEALRTIEAVTAMRQQAAQAQQVQALGPEALRQFGDVVREQMAV